MCRARRSEARIQQMLWKVNFSDIVFVNTVCATLLVYAPKMLNFRYCTHHARSFWFSLDLRYVRIIT